MTTVGTRNGYIRLPTVDPDSSEAVERKKKLTKTLRPGLFYMFGDRGRYADRCSESEETIELREVKPRRQKHRRLRGPKSPKSPKTPRIKQKFNIIEEPILPGDTVQRVALRYGCHASEIRRVNNLYTDQHFFALKVVKIPVREHGILTEPQQLEKCRQNAIVERVPGTQSSSTSDDMRMGGQGTYYCSGDEEGEKRKEDQEEYSCDADDEKGESDGPEYREVSIQSALRWKYSRHALLNKFDEELQKVREDTDKRMSNLREVSLTLDSPTIHPILQKQEDRKVFFKDWRIIVIFLTVIVIIIGLFYYLVILFRGSTGTSQSPKN